MGGQSIPAFDHYMAPGVAKTFVKELYKVLDIKYPRYSGHSIEGKLSNEGVKEELKAYRNKHRLIMDNLDYVKELLATRYSGNLSRLEIAEVIEKAISLTDEATHQSMEAVIHNLNSMHSRAGAQVL